MILLDLIDYHTGSKDNNSLKKAIMKADSNINNFSVDNKIKFGFLNTNIKPYSKFNRKRPTNVESHMSKLVIRF
jgi:hypothetical protein